MRRSYSPFVAVVLSVGCIFAAGCSSGGGGRTDESTKAIDSMRGTRQGLVKAKGEIQQANASLDRLASGRSVEQSYQQYTKDVAELKAAGDRARARALDMRTRNRQYMARWQQEMDQITSPELKASATGRRESVRQNFDKVASAARSTGDAYRPTSANSRTSSGPWPATSRPAASKPPSLQSIRLRPMVRRRRADRCVDRRARQHERRHVLRRRRRAGGEQVSYLSW